MQRYLNMQSLKQAFKTFDIGGVHPVHTVQGSGNLYKSSTGGLISFLILLLSSLYSVFVLYNWHSGQILPRSQTSKKTIDYEEFKFDYNPVDWVFSQPSADTIDPFQHDQMILIPMIQIVSDINFSPPDFIQPKAFLQNTQWISLNESRLSQNLSMAHNPNQYNNRPPYMNETQYLVTFLKCQPYLLQANQTCANQSVMTDYFSIGGKSIVMSVYFEEFEESNLTFVRRIKPYFFLLDDSQCLYTQVVLRTKNMTVASGPILQQKIHKNFLYSVEVQTQTISKNELTKMFGVEGYATFFIRLDSVKEFEDISYPTFGEVGAQIASIIGVIFWMKMVIIFYNTREYQSELIEVIISLSKIEDTNQMNTENQVTLSKELALEKTNIFNVHIELAKMRTILDQIVEKSFIKSQQDVLFQNLIPDDSVIVEINQNQIKDSKIGKLKNKLDADRRQIPIVPVNRSFKMDLLNKKPDKNFQIELQNHEYAVYDDFREDYYKNIIKDDEKAHQQQKKLIADLELLQRPMFPNSYPNKM